MTAPHLLGAVLSAAELPAAPSTGDVVLTRDTRLAHCWNCPDAPHAWATAPWAPACEMYFGLTAEQVPDLQQEEP